MKAKRLKAEDKISSELRTQLSLLSTATICLLSLFRLCQNRNLNIVEKSVLITVDSCLSNLVWQKYDGAEITLMAYLDKLEQNL